MRPDDDDPLELDALPIDDVDAALLLAPHGPIRGREGEAFRQRLDELLDRTEAVLLDLSDVDSVDSAALGYLLNVHDRLAAKGGGLALAAVTPGVRVVIDSIGLTSFFVVHDTVEEGENALRQWDLNGPDGHE